MAKYLYGQLSTMTSDAASAAKALREVEDHMNDGDKLAYGIKKTVVLADIHVSCLQHGLDLLLVDIQGND